MHGDGLGCSPRACATRPRSTREERRASVLRGGGQHGHGGGLRRLDLSWNLLGRKDAYTAMAAPDAPASTAVAHSRALAANSRRGSA